MNQVKQDYKLSLNKSCQIMSLSKIAYYYRSKKRVDDDDIQCYLFNLSHRHPRWGFDKMMLKIKMDHKPWNHKRVYRIYCHCGLNIRIKPKKHIPKGQAQALVQPICANVCWSMDFMSDVFISTQTFRTFNVIDDYNRECLLIELSHSLPASTIIQLLDRIATIRGYPNMVRVDNGPEFISKTFKKWAELHQVVIHYIQPGKPAQNAYIKRFNRTYREDILDMNLFQDLNEVRCLTQHWIHHYNHERPHQALMGLPPILFIQKREKTTRQDNNSKFYFQLVL